MEKGLVLFIYLLLISLFSLAGIHPLKEDPKCKDCHATLFEKQSIHDPAKNGCDQCHQINTADHSQNNNKGLFLLKKQPELCYTCHVDTKKEIDTTRMVHPAVNIKKQCTNCHSPHSSNEKKMLTANKKELCLGCHDREEVIFGKKITNIKQLLKTSKVIHPAIVGGCTSCHKPHASTENFLLIGAYPAGQYAEGKKDNYAVCWECHDSDLLELASTSTATSFRDGERNLHFVHMNGKKGRSCSICHDSHATKREHLIVDKVPFGEWEMPINYIPSETGGSCFPGCHQQYQYTR
jgi:predicted CXXCH cytochrome family protein